MWFPYDLTKITGADVVAGWSLQGSQPLFFQEVTLHHGKADRNHLLPDFSE